MRTMKLAAALGMILSLQGCAVYEYIFGGPDPEDMPQIQMKAPAAAVATPHEVVNQPAGRQYPTGWTTQQLLD